MSDQIRQLDLLLQVVPTEQKAIINGEWATLWQGVDSAGNQYVLFVMAAMALDEGAEAELSRALESRPQDVLVIIPPEGGES